MSQVPSFSPPPFPPQSPNAALLYCLFFFTAASRFFRFVGLKLSLAASPVLCPRGPLFGFLAAFLLVLGYGAGGF